MPIDAYDIAYQVRGAVYDVFNNLGPGLLESAYESALIYQLQQRGLKVKSQVAIDIPYGDIVIKSAFRLDILVEGTVIVELKSVEQLSSLHYKQLRTYLRLTGNSVGLLVNFNTDDILKSMHNVTNDTKIKAPSQK